MEGIFRSTAKGGKMIFAGEDMERYCLQYEGEEFIVKFSHAAKQSQKQKLYNYWHGPMMDAAVLAFAHAGHEGVDKVVADYKIRAEVGKDFTKNPDGTFEPYLLPKERMSTLRLHKLVCDGLFYMESNFGMIPPDAEEYKMMKITSRQYERIKKDV